MALTKVTGQVIKNTTDVTVGVLTVTNTLAVGGTVSIGGTLTYEDVTNVDAVGLITARNGIVVGSGITLSKDGDVFFTGIATGNGSGLTAINASNIASGTVPTARLGSGTASSSTFLRGDSSFQTVNTDLVSDTSPQLGGNLDVNTKNIVFGDSGGASDDRLTFGAGTDLSIFHDGTDSFIDNATGGLKILGDTIRLKGKSADENMVVASVNGAIELYHNASKKFETASYGVSTDGLLNFNGTGDKILLADDGKISFGGGGDLDIYHSGGTNYCDIASGQQLYFRVGGSNKFYVQSGGAQFVGSLYGDDDNKIELGSSQDLEIFHDGTHAQFYNVTGETKIRGNDIRLQNAAGNENYFVGFANDYAALYYDNTQRIKTTSDGAATHGMTRFADSSGATGGFTECFVSGTVSNSGTFTAQTYNCHAGGLVTITTNRRPSGSNNKNISVFPIVLNSTSNASLGSALSSMAGSSGSSFSVAGTSRGVIVTNTSGLDQRISVRFDIAGV